MRTPPPQQPTFAEAEEIATNPYLQVLLRWYPDQHAQILASLRRRQRPFYTPCSCQACTAPTPQLPAHRPKAPSSAGQYRRQVAK